VGGDGVQLGGPATSRLLWVGSTWTVLFFLFIQTILNCFEFESTKWRTS
jgi:hypothetical protein